ncbi:MAG: flagellar assembly protein FliX [Alphaproteobacteria bacterium]|nr:flagellar assembly protein FliX [Alphaproteobacteria bacterium]
MIEKVGYTRPVAPARPTKRAGNVAAPGFAEALAQAEGVGTIEAAGGIGAVGALGGLLGAQEVDEREARRRKAAKRGRLTLDMLANLRDALLIGSLPYSTLRQLEHLLAEERGEATDPELMSILNEIEVRAAVELAKLEMSGITVPLSAPGTPEG